MTPNTVTSSLSRPDEPLKVTEEKNSFCSPPGGSRLAGGAEAAHRQEDDGRCLRPNVCPPRIHMLKPRPQCDGIRSGAFEK